MKPSLSSSSNFKSDSMEGVPAFIFVEVDPVDLDPMDYDFFTDDDDSYNGDVILDLDEDDGYDVTRQDLDALKRMVQEIRDNPSLLTQSPVYSDRANMLTNSQDRPSPSQVVLTGPYLSTEQTWTRLPLAPKTHVDPSFLCQECNSTNVCSPSPTEQFHPFAIFEGIIPPLPFQD